MTFTENWKALDRLHKREKKTQKKVNQYTGTIYRVTNIAAKDRTC